MIITGSSRWPTRSAGRIGTATPRSYRRRRRRTGTPRRAAAYAEVIAAELPDGGTVGFLVWGDPAFYDSTIRIVESVAALGRRSGADRDPGDQQRPAAGRPRTRSS